MMLSNAKLIHKDPCKVFEKVMTMAMKPIFEDKHQPIVISQWGGVVPEKRTLYPFDNVDYYERLLN